MTTPLVLDERQGFTSASNAQADFLCPGRHLAQAGLPATPDADADFGTQIHQALAKRSTEGLTLEQMDIMHSCDEIAFKCAMQFFEKTDGLTIIIETRLWNQFGTYRHSGRVDRVYHDGQKALIIEFKTLPGEVPDSPANAQLRDQAVLVAGTYKIPVVATVVVQPPVTHDPEICVYQMEDLRRAEGEMQARVIRSNDPGSPRIPGEIQCKFCRAKTQCVEYHAWAARQLPVPAALVDIPVANWTPEQCAQFLSQRAVAQGWLDDAYEAIKTRLKANKDAIPGFSLRDGANVRKVTNPQELFNRFLAAAEGSTKEQAEKLFMKAVNIGNEKFKEALHELTGLKGQKLDNLLDTLFSGIVESKRNQPSIVKKKGQ